MSEPIPILDGHNDTLTRIVADEADPRSAFLSGRDAGHVDLPRARQGGLAGAFFAIFTPSRGWAKELRPMHDAEGRVIEGGFSVPPPPRVDRRRALGETLRHAAELLRWERASEGALTVVRSTGDLARSRATGSLAAILHIEGAACIDTRLEALEVLYAAGLRSLGLVWSRPNAFGHGVPFDFPRAPDIGPGLTAAGHRLVKACERLGIMIDLSHLNAAGFWDVASRSDRPLVATHSSAFALSPSPRNLTDAQLDAVADSGGLVGVNFHTGFLRADGDWTAATSLERIVAHARYIADRIGVEHVALGSDFDGATMPGDLPDVAALPRLVDALRDGGFDQSDLHRIGFENWERVLGDWWHD
ncbi:MAG: membrane dipeptidase [Gemmatimonadetes bacterium]|nr:membrane dipeptidase [Gemmatimonadota bacterium]